MTHALFRAALAASFVAFAGCAAPAPGAPPGDGLQKAASAIGEMLGAKPQAPGRGAAPGGGAPPGGGRLMVINGINVVVEGDRPADPRWQGKRVAETALAGFFSRHPIARPGDYWPRVAIRVDDYSDSLVASSNIQYLAQLPGSMVPNVARPHECLKFTAVAWMSPAKSERLDGVVLCSSDIKASDEFLSNGALRSYRTLMAPISISSEQVRTFGPREPAKLLPSAAQEDVQLYSNGQHLFSALFVQLGYRGPLDGDQRLWFVSLAKKAP